MIETLERPGTSFKELAVYLVLLSGSTGLKFEVIDARQRALGRTFALVPTQTVEYLLEVNGTCGQSLLALPKSCHQQHVQQSRIKQ